MVIPPGRTRPVSLLLRAAALVVTAGVLVGVAATPAGATTNPSLALDPAGMVYGVGPAQNAGPVDVRWGGRLAVTLPAGLVDDGSLLVTLGVGASPDSPSVVYSDSPGANRRLKVTALGAEQVQVDLPANDGVDGPMGSLTLTHVGIRGGVGVREGTDQPYVLRFSPRAPAAVALAAQLRLVNSLPSGDAPSLVVAPGSAFDLTLPVDARLSRLGVPGLRTAAFSLRREDRAGAFTGASIELGPVLSNDGRTVFMTVPPATAAGSYQLEVVVGDDSATVRADVDELLRVQDAMAVPGLIDAGSSTPAPAIAAGPEVGPPVLPLGWMLPLTLGAALLLIAAVGGAAGLLGSRRRTSVGGRS